MLGEVLQPTEASATASDINHHREHRLEQGVGRVQQGVRARRVPHDGTLVQRTGLQAC